MEQKICVYCDKVINRKKYVVNLDFDPYEIVTEADVCSGCGVITFIDEEAYAFFKASKVYGDISEHSFRFLVECIKRLDFNSFFVKDDEGGVSNSIESINAFLGYSADVIKAVLLELWKKRLVLEIKSNLGTFLVVNVVALNINDKDTFTRRNFFAHDFYKEDTRTKENARKRLIRKGALINDFTQEDRVEVLERFGGKCALTGKDVPIHLDHVIPLAVGHGGTTKANMLPIWQRINTSKSDRNIFEWYKENGERFDVCPKKFEEAIEYLAELNEMSVAEYRDYVYECHAIPNDILAKESV